MAEGFNCTECKIAEVSFVWRVRVPFLQTTDGKGESIWSPCFSSRETPGSTWNLAVYDQGSRIIISAFHCDSISLSQVSSDLLKVVIPKSKELIFRRPILPVHPAGCQMTKSEASLDKNDRMEFYCTIIALGKKEPVSSIDAINCREGLSTQLEELFDSMQFSDVIFKVGASEFPAHKNILVARIKPFAAMFNYPTTENSTNQIMIEDVEPEVFHQLLRFIYTGRLSTATMESMGVGLFIAADKYLVEDLKMRCRNYLLCKLSPANCLELLTNGSLPSSAGSLKAKAAYIFLRCPGDVMATYQWKELKRQNPSLLCDIQTIVSRYKWAK